MKNIFIKIKKLFAIFLVFLSCFSLFACNGIDADKINKQLDAINENVDKINKALEDVIDLANFYTNTETVNNKQTSNNVQVFEDKYYTSKNEVAVYIITYRHLPGNYIKKDEAESKGWKNGKTLDKAVPGFSIGGDTFGNYEKKLPTKNSKNEKRKYIECDIDYVKGNRNAKRIVYATDFDQITGCIYYTEDHYNTFEKLY